MAVSTVDIQGLSQAVHDYLTLNLYVPTFQIVFPSRKIWAYKKMLYKWHNHQ